MSKKTKRARRPNVPMQTGPVQPAEAAGGGEAKQPATQSAARASTRAASRAVALGGAETINADYSHVISDLKRIGALAGGLLAILVVLSFFIK
nr:hypothetical protein [Chloroflexota bacterium]